MSKDMNWKPKPWIAAILAFFIGFPGFFYTLRISWGVFYFVLHFAVFFIGVLLKKVYPEADWLPYLPLMYVLLMPIRAVHAYLLAKGTGSTSKRPWYSKWWGLILVSLLILACLVQIRIFFYETFRVPSGAMNPTLKSGDTVLVEKWPYGNYGTSGITVFRKKLVDIAEPERGDVMVFEFPKNRKIFYIKRVIGLPGDLVKYQGKKLTVNDEEIMQVQVSSTNEKVVLEETLGDKSYRIVHSKAFSVSKEFELQIPDDQYFVLGDNRENSSDSRVWGMVPKDHLVGKVIFIW